MKIWLIAGAYNAIKNRTANIDLLIAIGTWTAYLYSVFVIFFPNVLPVKEKEVYFEVAAIIIAFVLFGKYMEEIIKKRSSVAMALSSLSVVSNSMLLRRLKLRSTYHSSA